MANRGLEICDINSMDAVLDVILDEYRFEAEEAVGEAVRRTTKEMRDETKATAPVQNSNGKTSVYNGWRFPTKGTPGDFKKAISYRYYKGKITGVWYVKAPHYRLTHLLERGHAQVVFGKRTGRFTSGKGFVLEARDNAADKIVGYVRQEIGQIK